MPITRAPGLVNLARPLRNRQSRTVNTFSQMAKHNVIAIIGTTGVGKTQLALDLARSIEARATGSPRNAEIINADSMQVYRGLDVITNKATQEERAEIRHHLMDILDPGEEYRVDHFRQDAMNAIEEVAKKDALPIVVGGTMYFVQHLLFPGKLVSAEEETNFAGGVACIRNLDDLGEQQRKSVTALSSDLRRLIFEFEKLPMVSTPTSFPPGFPKETLPDSMQDPEAYTAAVYQCLKAVDPDMATKWHWRDIRKVSRSLQIYLQTGRPHSSIMQQQAEVSQEAEYRTLIFWPYSEPGVLERRLDTRVEQMCTKGLLDEIRGLRKLAAENGHLDLSKGIYQAIGYKEFSQYFEEQEVNEDTEDEISYDSPKFRQAVEDMKLGTRQYARRQIKWIRNKLLPVIEACKSSGHRDQVYLYLLDATSPEDWSTSVKEPAEDILSAFLRGQPMPNSTSLNPMAGVLLQPSTSRRPAAGTPAKVRCDVCTIDIDRPYLVEEGEQMQAHRGSRAHRKRVQKLAKVQQNPARQRNHLDDVPQK